MYTIELYVLPERGPRHRVTSGGDAHLLAREMSLAWGEAVRVVTDAGSELAYTDGRMEIVWTPKYDSWAAVSRLLDGQEPFNPALSVWDRLRLRSSRGSGW